MSGRELNNKYYMREKRRLLREKMRSSNATIEKIPQNPINTSSDEDVFYVSPGPSKRVKISGTSIQKKDRPATTYQDNDLTAVRSSNNTINNANMGNQASTSNGSSSVSCSHCCDRCALKDDMLVDSIRECAKMTLEMVEMVKDVLKELRTFPKNDAAINRQPGMEQTVFVRMGIVVPIDSDEALERFETELEDVENFSFAKMEIANIGGNRLVEFISRSMRFLFTDDMAVKYSWLGRKGKRIFANLNTAKLIIAACQETKLSTNLKEIETGIMSWLRRANERRSNNQASGGQIKHENQNR